MNELQKVLLVFAIIVVGVLFFLHQRKKSQQNKSSPKTKYSNTLTNAGGEQTLNNLDGSQLKNSLDADLAEEEEIPESQGKLSFGEEFDDVKKPKHYVVYDSSFSVKQLNEEKIEESKEPLRAEKSSPLFGKPAEENKTADIDKNNPPAVVTAEKPPEVFVITIMGTKEFNMPPLNQFLLSLGIIHSERGIYVKRNSQGKEYIHIANILEPGTFPNINSEEFEKFKVQGIALILELPTHVKAPAAMNDMVDIARKVSQKFNARLYDRERKLLKESEIQTMRDKAISYEATEVVNS